MRHQLCHSSKHMLVKSFQLRASICAFSTDTLEPIPSVRRKTYSHIFQECTRQKALNPGKQAHAQMVISGFKATVFVTNCLIQMYVRCSSLSFATKVFDHMSQRDTVSWNSLMFAHAGVGDMKIAQLLFDTMPEKDVISWNSLISGYLQNGDYSRSIEIFLQMGKVGAYFDHTTIAMVLKSCSSLGGNFFGRQIHALATKVGMSYALVCGCSLVDMYAKSQNLDDSLKLFNEIPDKNGVCWSAVLAGCVQNDFFMKGLELFREMQSQGVGVSQSIYASMFRACASLSNLKLGCQLHGHSIKTKFDSDIVVATATLDMYSKCCSLTTAQRLFSLLSNHNLQSYNALMVGCVRNGRGFEVLQLFQSLRRSGLGFDAISLSVAFSACASLKHLPAGCQHHVLALKSDLLMNVCVVNAILDMYGKCGAITDARAVFDQMLRRDAVSWNAIVASYEQNGQEEEALSLFVTMLYRGFEPDEFTYGGVLRASATNQASRSGVEIHSRIIKSGMGLHPFVGSALVDMYCKCRMIDEAMKLHYRIEHQNTVSWNAIMSGYSSQEEDEKAQKFFSFMLEMGVEPDNFTYATILDACANLATVGLGKQIHAQTIKHDLQSDTFIVSALVDMYSKCGNMQDSRLMFEKAGNRDYVTWNAMLCGYAYHGFAREALELFEKMQVENVKPNHATFVAILRACGHMGLAEKGLYYFHLMHNYSLHPSLDHYTCMVDILGRSGRISEALRLIDNMPFEADDIIWRTLLSVCKTHGNVVVAEKAANSIMQLDPEDSSAYILLTSIYADAGMWHKVSMIRKEMRRCKMRKEPGCSWIEMMSGVHTFLANERSHPDSEGIYGILHNLYDEISVAKRVHGPEISPVSQGKLPEEHNTLILASGWQSSVEYEGPNHLTGRDQGAREQSVVGWAIDSSISFTTQTRWQRWWILEGVYPIKSARVSLCVQEEPRKKTDSSLAVEAPASRIQPPC